MTGSNTMPPRHSRQGNPPPRPAKGATPRRLSRKQVADAVAMMGAPSGAARFAAGKALCHTAGLDPQRVYPYFEALAALLDSESKVIRWNALLIMALLAPVDEQHRLDGRLDRYLGLLRGHGLITAANAIRGAALIALARPDLVDRIVSELIKVERTQFETPECRNVAIGEALGALQSLGLDVCRRPAVAEFAMRQLRNSRPKVARMAEEIVNGVETGTWRPTRTGRSARRGSSST